MYRNGEGLKNTVACSPEMSWFCELASTNLW